MPDQVKPIQPSAVTPRFDGIAVVLAILLVFCASASLAMAEWVPNLDVLSLTVVVSGSLGALIAASRWRSRTAQFMMIMYGIAWVTLVGIGYMSDKVYGFTWLDTVRHLLVRLGEHIYIWGEAISSGGVGKDNTIFVLLLAAIFWLLAYLAVWNTVRRQRLWRAAAPAGVIILINMYYYGGQAFLATWLIIYLFAVLLYASRLYTLRQAQRWQFGRIRFKPEIERDFLQLGATIALAAVFFGTVAPSIAGAPQLTGAWREISRPVRSIEDTFSRLFSSLQPHGIPYNNPFGRTLALLGQRNLGKELVLEVRSPEARYWQGVVYNYYTGGAFQSSESDRVEVKANAQIVPTAFRQRDLITQTVTGYFPNNTLIFAAAQPTAVDQPSWIDQLPGGEFSMWTTLSPMGPGDTYQVVSSVSRATIEQLRLAGSTYPATIRDRYLQLPDTLPDRVRVLARQIVTEAHAVTPYDQAAALETWLRTNITYNDQVPSPAAGQDGVDYVLFVTKQGFCDYYASAMAVMARSLGLPARVVTGYTSGTYDEQRGVYQVHQNNAHTWPEIYFPQYGWIQFEPTASQPLIDRPVAGAAANKSNSPAEDPNIRSRANIRDRNDQEFDPFSGAAKDATQKNTAAAVPEALQTLLVLAVSLIGLVVLIGGGGWAAVWWYENRHQPRPTGGGSWAFARLTRLGGWLRVKLSAAYTPFEQAQLIGQAVPKRQSEIDQLAELYVRERYGRTTVDAQEPRSIWQHIHWSLWQAGLRRRMARRLPHWPARWRK